MGHSEQRYVKEAFTSNWLSTVGPHISAFEDEFATLVGQPAVALSSGTAAIHLALRLLGTKPGDEVFCQDLTFVASANPIRYLGAKPVFIDSNYETWNMDPGVLADALRQRAIWNRLPRAVIVVDLFGQFADLEPLLEICRKYEVPLLEDAAEALGGSYKNRSAGTWGDIGAFSFNGNKIITTTGGGMLVSSNQEWIEKARYWSTQARCPGIAYEHSEMGYNYRLSNVLAGIGRGQLQVLGERVEQRRRIAFRYRDAFSDLEGITFMPQAEYGLHTNWLSCFLIDQEKFGHSRDELIRILDAAGVESRPVWKPMHMQKLFEDCSTYGGSVAEQLFAEGICLPSSSSLTPEEHNHVVNVVREAAESNGQEILPGAQTVCTF